MKANENELKTWILEILATLLSVSKSQIDSSKRLSFYGLNSKNAVQFTQKLTEFTGKAFDTTIVWEYPTLNDLVGYISSTGDEKRKGHVMKTDLRSEPIAIIGMGCKFPESPNLHAYWELLKNQKSGISKVPAEKWNIADYYNEDFNEPGKMNTEWGGFLKDNYDFDPLFFGISPIEAPFIDPQQRLMLEVTWQALDDASVIHSKLRGSKTGVFSGAIWNDYALMCNRMGDKSIGKYTATGNHHSIISNRVSYLLGLRGPSMTIDTACSSSLVAVHLAVQSLRLGESELAIAGGVNLILTPESTLAMSKLGAMAPDGQSKAFDASANGYVRGEGAGAVILKPLSKAIKDGDKIYSVILSTATNNDGYSNGLTAPSPQAQEEVLQSAYSSSGIDPQQVQYVETHGTGTRLGDPIEARALGNILGKNRQVNKSLILGSVKSQIGHLEGAAGIAGLIKVALSIKNRHIPANLNFETPNPNIPFEDYNLKVANEPMSWQKGKKSLAGVTSIGFGGTNCHVVLEEFSIEDKQLLIYGGKSNDDLESNLKVIRKGHENFKNEVSLKEFCLAVNASYSPVSQLKGGVLINNHDELKRVLSGDLLVNELDGNPIIGKDFSKAPIAFVCSGQGSKWLGLAKQLVTQERVFRSTLEQCDQELLKYTGTSIIKFLLADVNEEKNEKAEVIQPVFVAIQIALANLWKSWGVNADLIVGHSLGELSAACIGGYLSLSDAIKVAYFRGIQYSNIIAQNKGLTALVTLTVKEIHKYLEPYSGEIEIVVYNSSQSNVIAGEIQSMKALLKKLERDGKEFKTLNIGKMAAHSFQMDDIANDFYESIGDIEPLNGDIPLYSTVFEEYLNGDNYNKSYWVQNIKEPVKFTQVVRKLVSKQPIFIELSAHPTLREAIIETGKEHKVDLLVLNSLEKGFNDRESLLRNLAQLVFAGKHVLWKKVLGTNGASFKLKDFLGGDLSIKNNSLCILPISAHTEKALDESIEALSKISEETSVYDLAYELSKRRSNFDCKAAFVVDNSSDVNKMWSEFSKEAQQAQHVFVSEGESENNGVVFVFSGQGSQYLNVGKSLYNYNEAFRNKINECDRLLSSSSLLNHSMKDLICLNDNSELLEDTQIVQPLIFSIQVALVALWENWGVKPSVVVGHSLGEVAALHVAGSIDLKEALLLVAMRGRLMQRIKGEGCMLSLLQPKRKVEEFLKDCGLNKVADIAVVNSSNGTIVSIDNQSKALLERKLEEHKIKYKLISTQYAFHSNQLNYIQKELPALINSISYKKPSIEVYSSTTGKQVQHFDISPQFWVNNCLKTVDFYQTMKRIANSGNQIFLEVGINPDLHLHMLKTIEDERMDSKLLYSLKKGENEVESIIKNAAKAYTFGIELKWENILTKETNNEVYLPDFSYQKETYKVNLDEGSINIPNQKKHPLVHQEIPLAFSKQQLFQSAISMSDLRWLTIFEYDFDSFVYPFSCMFEMGFFSAKSLPNDRVLTLQNVDFNDQVLSKNDEVVSLQLVLNPSTEEGSVFEVFNLDNKHNQALCSGKVAFENNELLDQVSLTQLKEKCKEIELKETALHPKFNVKSIFKYTGISDNCEVLLNVSTPAEYKDDHFQIHPILMESVAIAINGIYKVNQYPVFIEKATCKKSLNDEAWVHIKTINESCYNVSFYDNEGCLCANLEGLRLRPIEELCGSVLNRVMGQDQLEKFLFELEWKLQETVSDKPDFEGKNWLLICNDSEVRMDIVNSMKESGVSFYILESGMVTEKMENKTYCFNFKQEDCFEKLFEFVPELQQVDGIIYVAEENENIEPQFKSLNDQNDNLFKLIKAFGKSPNQSCTNLVIFTQGLLSFNKYKFSAIPGLCKVVRQENVFRDCQHIDVLDKTYFKDFVISDAVSSNHSSLLMNSKGVNYHRVVKPRNYLPGNSYKISQDKMYLITGGTGDLGHDTILSLLELGAKHLIVFSRYERHKGWGELELKYNCKIELVVADICSLQQMRKVCDRFKGKIGGIVHAAGYMKPQLLVEQTLDNFQEQLKPKVDGGMVLHQISLKEPLDFFISFSSISSVIGAKGLSAYSAANSFLDGLMSFRRGQGLKGVSINWGPIQSTKMSEELSSTLMEKSGIKLLSKDNFRQLFKYVIFSDLERIIIADIKFDIFTKYFGEELSLGSESGTYQDFQYMNEEVLMEEIKKELLNMFEKVLGVKNMNVEKNFFDAGMDSLLVMELRSAIKKHFDMNASMSSLYAKPTIKDLSLSIFNHFMKYKSESKKYTELVK
ncbi:MAG: acyl transferase domain-containing protein/acyl carrier protein/short-subunit dehydrogenase [Cyclobacteriaceae bacterium]|jgi:acyl transferase domain-containing protein/acyl carrier protein/short-subunit dehydrogenase